MAHSSAVLAQARRPVRTAAAPVPLWRQLHALAAAAMPGVQDRWYDALRAFHEAVREDEALAGVADSLFAAEPLLLQAWERTVGELLVQSLPALLLPLLTASAEASLAALETTFALPALPYLPETREDVQQVTALVQQDAQRIAGTTLLALRMVQRQDTRDHVSHADHVRHLGWSAGLTPQQALGLLQMARQLQEQGVSRRRRALHLERQAQRRLLLRSVGIADTETMATVNAGITQALTQTLQRGRLAALSVRQYWQVTPPDVCDRCLAMAATHPRGVAVGEVFLEAGSAVRPPLHSRCKCIVALRRAEE